MENKNNNSTQNFRDLLAAKRAKINSVQAELITLQQEMGTKELAVEIGRNAIPGSKVEAGIQGGVLVLYVGYKVATTMSDPIGEGIGTLVRGAVALGLLNMVRHDTGEAKELVRRAFPSKVIDPVKNVVTETQEKLEGLLEKGKATLGMNKKEEE